MAFGESAENYHEARRPYPQQIFDSIANQSNAIHEKKLLDVGCGTGIATVELKKLGFGEVRGCDYDQDMIDEALNNNTTYINYTCAPTNTMLYENNYFDVVTTFGAFHWFCDTESITEIKRVLKPNGLFFVINKNDTSEFRNEIMDIAKRHTELRQAFQRKNYHPDRILASNGFISITLNNFNSVETYNLEQLIALVKSMRFWNHVPDDAKSSLTNALLEHFSKQLVNQYYQRLMTVSLVSGVCDK